MAARGLNPFVPLVENRTTATTVNSHGNGGGEIESQVRPRDTIIQSQNDDDRFGGDGFLIKVKVSRGSNQFDVTVPSHSTFGDVKRVVAQEIGLEPKEQRLFFRGKEKEDQEYLEMAGVKDNAKLLLMEDSKKEAKNVQEVKRTMEVSRGRPAVAEVSAEVDKLSEQVSAVQTAIYGGTQVTEKEIVYLTEMLMKQLLILDGIEAEGEGKVQRKMEVHRIQSFVEAMDTLKAKNSNLVGNSSNSAAVTSQWETFDSGVGSNAPNPVPSGKATNNEEQTQWVKFESGVGSDAPPPAPPAQVTDNEEQTKWATFDAGAGSLNGSTVFLSSAKVAQVQEQSKWEPFDSGVGLHNASRPMSSSTKVTQDWEQFD